MALWAYDRPLEMLKTFNYLGRVLTASYDDCPEVVANIQKSRSIWAQLSRVLSHEGAYLQTSGTSYKAVFQVTLLFFLDT